MSDRLHCSWSPLDRAHNPPEEGERKYSAGWEAALPRGGREKAAVVVRQLFMTMRALVGIEKIAEFRTTVRTL